MESQCFQELNQTLTARSQSKRLPIPWKLLAVGNINKTEHCKGGWMNLDIPCAVCRCGTWGCGLMVGLVVLVHG